MSKELTYSVKQVQTPLGVASVSTPDDEVVIATVSVPDCLCILDS